MTTTLQGHPRCWPSLPRSQETQGPGELRGQCAGTRPAGRGWGPAVLALSAPHTLNFSGGAREASPTGTAMWAPLLAHQTSGRSEPHEHPKAVT